LTDCRIFMTDARNFDMPYHYLQLQRPNVASPPTTTTDAKDSTIVQDSSSTEPSNIFTVRPWTKLLLNEGSFIKAYSVSDAFNKIPPSILPDLLGAEGHEHKKLFPATIRDMEYIAMFPLANHFEKLTVNCPRLDRLYTQFVPRNDILEREEVIENIEEDDLWGERNTCYALLMRELFNYPPLDSYRYLKEFESGDCADENAWKMAVEYVKRAGGGWRVEREGVFVKDNLQKETPAEDDEAEAVPSLLSVTDDIA